MSTINIQDQINILDNLIKDAKELRYELQKNKQYFKKAHIAEWHIKGLIYHYKKIVEYYIKFSQEVSSRVLKTGANVVIMFSEDYQTLLFEFYALVSLSKIALDNIRDIISPLFITPYNQLPKSIADFLGGKTDCPVYNWIEQQKIFNYLIDLRNCLVHYRSFASSDNAIIIEEGMDFNKILEEQKTFFEPMAKGEFRKIDDNNIVVNIYIPDIIFIVENNVKKLAKFSYLNKWNLLSQSRSFTQATSYAILMSMKIALSENIPLFSFNKKTSD